MSNCMLTTMDNPWNPFTHFDEWYHFDTVLKGYYTSSWLASFSLSNVYMTDEARDTEISIAMDEFLASPFRLPIHVKMYKEDGDNFVKICNETYKKYNKNDTPSTENVERS